MISSLVKERRKWSQFKDDKDISQAQRTQNLKKIAEMAEPGEETSIPKPWQPKWLRDKLLFEAEEAKLHAEAEAEAEAATGDGDGDGDDLLESAARAKPRINIVLVGPPNSGKSTIFGHLQHRFGSNYTTKKKLIQIEKSALVLGKGTKKFAWVSDRMQTERDRDSTITLSRAQLLSARFQINLTDIPSHRHFLKTSLHGISQADAAVLVISATTIEFRRGLGKYSVLHDHIFACFAFGIRQVVVALTKMDQINFDEATFEQRKEEINSYLIDVIGFMKEGITIVPIVGNVGDNMFPSEPKNKRFQPGLLVANENMPWYQLEEARGGGTTLIELLDNLVIPPTVSQTNLPVVVYNTNGKASPNSSPRNSPFNSPGTSPILSPISSSKASPRIQTKVAMIGFQKEEEEQGKYEIEKIGEEERSDNEDNTSNSINSLEEEKTNDQEKYQKSPSIPSPKSSVRSNKSPKSKNLTRRGPALRMPVSEVYHIPGVGTIAVGKIVSGSIGCYERIRICPKPLDYMDILADDDHDTTLVIPEEESEEELEVRLALGEVAKVKSIQIWKKNIVRRSHVRRGDYVGILLAPNNTKVGQRKGRKNVPLVQPGTVLGTFGIDQHPVRTVKEFHATIILFNLPCGNNETSLGVSTGWSPVVDVHTAHVQCRVVEMILNRARGKDDRIAPAVDSLLAAARESDSRASRRRPRRGRRRRGPESTERKDEQDDEKPKRRVMFKTGDCCDVRMVPFRPLVVEPFDICPALARFVLRDGGRVVGSGLIKSVKFGMHHGSSQDVAESSSSSEEEESEGEDEINEEEVERGEVSDYS